MENLYKLEKNDDSIEIVQIMKIVKEDQTELNGKWKLTQIDSLDHRTAVYLEGGWMKLLHASEHFEGVFDHLIL